MSEQSRNDGDGIGSGGSLTTTAALDSGSPTGREGRGRLPAKPRTEKDDCRPTYSGQPLSSIASENSPSGGWRAVYTQMEVSPDGQTK
jgi:hypothetical protein